MAPELVLPYGPAPPASFMIHEIATYVLFVFCLLHAARRKAAYVSYLLGAVLFGLLLEYVNVNAGMDYSYGQFWLMLGPTPEAGTIPANIPVSVGVGWGIVIYTARLFSDYLGLPVWSRPALDALLALNIDLSTDAVAYRLNMWHWGWEFRPGQPDPLTSEWFGIPYGNFYGWLLVVFFYSAFARLLLEWQPQSQPQRQRQPRWLWLLISTTAAIILAQISLFLSIEVLPRWITPVWQNLVPSFVSLYLVLTIATAIAFACVVAIAFRRRHVPEKKDYHPLIWLVPTYFHVYFITWLFVAGFYQETFWLPAISVLNAALGIGIHQWGRLIRRKPKVALLPGVAVEN
jgi:hypothetical protein